MARASFLCSKRDERQTVGGDAMTETSPRIRSIIHCDMDAFFASVEQLRRPELKGKAVIVGGSPRSRGVVSTCSYEARKYGIHSAMSAAEAYRRCPDAVFLPPDFAKYKEVSSQMHRIFSDYTPVIEPLSLDEAFLDVTGSTRLFGPAAAIGQKIKERIRDELGLTVSVGVAHNKFLAKLVSDLSKPDGFFVVDPDRVQELLDPLDVRRIWGIGEKTARRLYSLNIKTIKELRSLDETSLAGLFGSFGHQLYRLARGIDNRPVESSREVKSVGRETTFAVDVKNRDDLERTLLELSCDVGRSLRKEGLKGRTVTLKIKYNDFKTITRSKTMEIPTNLDKVIFSEACRLLENLMVKPVRLAGVSVHNFVSKEEGQMVLFEEPLSAEEKLSTVMDLIKDKFGDNSITRARLLGAKD